MPNQRVSDTPLAHSAGHSNESPSKTGADGLAHGRWVSGVRIDEVTVHHRLKAHEECVELLELVANVPNCQQANCPALVNDEPPPAPNEGRATVQ